MILSAKPQHLFGRGVRGYHHLDLLDQQSYNPTIQQDVRMCVERRERESVCVYTFSATARNLMSSQARSIPPASASAAASASASASASAKSQAHQKTPPKKKARGRRQQKT